MHLYHYVALVNPYGFTFSSTESLDSHAGDKFCSVDHEKSASEEQNLSRAEKMKEKFDDKYDRDPREKLDRAERRRGEDAIDRATDRLSDRRERSIERMQERVTDKAPEKGQCKPLGCSATFI